MKPFHVAASIALIVTEALARSNENNCHPNPVADQYIVKSLPQVSFSLPKSWAGNLKIGPGYGNDSLYFWLWEAETQQGKDDLIIWFNGGPACSSLTGLFKIHGPVTFPRTSTTPHRNPYSWTQGANVVYVDQPTGTGFSTGTTEDNTNNSDNTAAVVKWLDSFFTLFPQMRSKKIHLMGESYAGVFLPYIAQEIKAQEASLNVELSSLSLGDALWGNQVALGSATILSYIAEHRSNYGTQIPQNFYNVLVQADKDCGFAAVRSQIKYPPEGIIHFIGNLLGNFKRSPTAPPVGYNATSCDFDDSGTNTPARLAYIVNNTACYGTCDPYDAAYNFYLSDAANPDFQSYNINEIGATGLYSDAAFIAYLNRADVKTAIHAPPPVAFLSCNGALGTILTDMSHRQSPPAYSIIPTLLSQGVKVNIFNGVLDFIIPHTGQDLVIQNMTWGGAQGFSRPATSDVLRVGGHKVGAGRSERGLSYYTFDDAGHRVAQDAPEAALEWLLRIVVNGGPSRGWKREWKRVVNST